MREANRLLRDQLSKLQGLLSLSMIMTDSSDEGRILDLATSSVPSLGRAHLYGAFLIPDGWYGTVVSDADHSVRADVEAQLVVLGGAGGSVGILHEGWGWAYPLRSLQGDFGYLVVAATEEPSDPEQFLMRVLAQQAGIALANTRLRREQVASTERMRTTNATLTATVKDLEQSRAVHDRLTRVAVAGEGEEGIARALNELTGFPVAIEDQHGNLRAWAGPDRPDPYPKDAPGRRQEMVRSLLEQGGLARAGDRLAIVARSPGDAIGIITLIDPQETAGEQERVALEHGGTVLAMELARLHSLAEAELRLRRDVVDELLAGTDEEGAIARTRALGYDLQRPHRVVVVACSRKDGSDDSLVHLVGRAARETEVGSLLTGRGDTVVLLSPAGPPWEPFRQAVVAALEGGSCRLGIGSVCDHPARLPRSYQEGCFALRLQDVAKSPDRVATFDDLGVYRVLADSRETTAIDDFISRWLGSLLDYDDKKGSDLVLTLSEYLEHGGSYEATSKALAVHRSTLKYRLQRIREISALDLGVPDINFNLQLATRAWNTLVALRDT